MEQNCESYKDSVLHFNDFCNFMCSIVAKYYELIANIYDTALWIDCSFWYLHGLMFFSYGNFTYFSTLQDLQLCKSKDRL